MGQDIFESEAVRGGGPQTSREQGEVIGKYLEGTTDEVPRRPYAAWA